MQISRRPGRLRTIALGAAALLFLLPAFSAHASCLLVTVKNVSGDPTPNLAAPISYVAAPPDGATVAFEGVAERLSDVLIYDSGVGAACFQLGNIITLTYSSPLLSAPGIDIFDTASSSRLAIMVVRSSTSVVNLTVTTAGTAGNLVSGSAGAAVRIKNLRADVSGTSSGLNVVVQGTATASGTLGGSLRNVGYVAHTIAAGAAIGTPGIGMQNAGGTLSTPVVFTFGENFPDAFRVSGSSGVSGDLAAGATSLVFDLSNTVPPGVTVTFPPALVTAGLSFALRSGGSCSGPVQCFAIYDTATNAAGAGTLTVTTAATARTGADGSVPAIGVQIASNSGAGTVTLRALLGPGAAGGANDDVNPAAVPRYVAETAPAAAPTRYIFNGTWFTVRASAPLLALSTTSLAFGPLLVGTSKRETVMLSNISMQLLQIGSITASGDGFQADNLCPMLLAASSSCTFSVTFAPAVEGDSMGSVTIVSNAAGSPHTITLSGAGQVVHGVPVIASLSPSGALAGSSWTRLVVNGTNFAHGAVVKWNGVGLGTSVLSATQLAAGIPPDRLAVVASAQITVENPPPGGGISNPATFTVFAGPPPSKPYLYYAPHVVSGGGFLTKFTIVNLASVGNDVAIHYVGQSGELLSKATFPLARDGTLRAQTPHADIFGPLLTQWAIIGSDAPLAVQVVVEQQSAPNDPRPGIMTSFADCVPADSFVIPAEFEPPPPALSIGRTMGVAIANPSPVDATAELKLVESGGRVVGSRSFALPPFGQTAVDLQQLDEFRAALPASNFVGSLAGSATVPVCVLALLDNYGPLLAAPVVRKSK